MKFFLGFILIINTGLGYSQAIPRKVVDKETNSPVSYATVKVLHTSKGVIASEQGEFDLIINNADSVLFSCAGYQTKILTGKEIDSIIYLNKRIKTLQEVAVRNGKIIRTIVLGNGAEYLKTRIRCRLTPDGSKDDCWPYWPDSSGEFSERIDLPDSNDDYRIKKIIIPVRDRCKAQILLHIYAAAPGSDKPGEELLRIPFWIEYINKYHKAVINTESKNIIVHNAKSFFIGYTWVKPKPDNIKHNCIPGILLKHSTKANTYSRSLYYENYNWFKFTQMVIDNTSGLSTLFAVELDVMK